VDSLALSASAGVDWQSLWIALGLLVLAVALVVLELFVVSFGVLLVASIASAAGAIHYAFAANDAAGWAMAAAVPILAVVLARWGLARIRRSRTLVPKGEISAEAGYHHHAETVGVRPGASGVMVTPARPSGRARFTGGECDVQAQSGVLARGAKVTVLRIDGPIVFVAPDGDEEP
jgi:membrane-bound serine protease (ClpP class)